MSSLCLPIKSKSLLLEEPTLQFSTGSKELRIISNKQRYIESIHKFRVYSSSSTSITSYDFPTMNQYSHGSSIFLNTYSDIDYLEDAFLFINSEEVKRFMYDHNEIISAIMECILEIFIRFDIIRPKMELIIDVEIPDWTTLFITIPSGADYEESYELLNDLIQNWAFLQSKAFKKLITITIG